METHMYVETQYAPDCGGKENSYGTPEKCMKGGIYQKCGCSGSLFQDKGLA